MADPRRATITIAEVDRSKDNRVGVKASDGTWYGCWDKKLWPHLTAGASLNIELTSRESNGRTYENITGVLGTAAASNGTASSDKERHIIREAALKAACFSFKDLDDIGGQTDTNLDFILRAADRFVRWIEQTEEEAPF